MPDRSFVEMAVRWAIFLPLAFIALQVFQMSRLLPPSRAWTHLAIGFGIIAIRNGYVLLVPNAPPLSFLVLLFAGFMFIALGFYKAKLDIQRVRDIEYTEEEVTP